MTTTPPRPQAAPESAEALRKRAEARARLASPEPAHPEALSPEDIRAAFHELAVHQIELEMQNEELRRVQEALDAARARYFDLYDLAPVGYCTLDEEGRILEANLAAARLLGTDRARLAGTAFSHFVAADRQDAWYLHRKALVETEAPQTFELRLRREADAPVWVWATSSVLASEGSQPPLFLLVLNDISRRRAAEAEREVLRAQLDQAERLEALGALAGGVAHDFNNILAGILAWLSTLKFREGRGEALEEDVVEVEGLVERGAKLSRQLLGYARRGKYDVRALDLGQAMETTATLFGRTCPDVELERQVAPDLPAVLMDHAQLEQVILNLLVNAGQAMPEGGRVRMVADALALDGPKAAAEGVAPGRFVRLKVTDTGPGMDAATQARVFEPFFTTKGLGTGLGLASAYGILKNHGGSIRVDSAPGQGATFTVLLPATDQPAPRPPAGPAARPEPAQGTILVVDDEPAVRRMSARLLESLGYQVLVAGGGEEAVALVRDQPAAVDLVLLDLTMPGMNGGQTFDALRTLVPGIKVLLASGFSASRKAQEILDRGCNGFIQKPFDRDTLLARIREIL